MSAPVAKRPNRPITLTADVESIVPAAPLPTMMPASAPHQAPSHLHYVDDDFVPKKRSFSFTPNLIKRAQRAYELQRLGDAEYGTLNALVNEALEREIARLSDKYNNGQPIEPNTTGTFRRGRADRLAALQAQMGS